MTQPSYKKNMNSIHYQPDINPTYTTTIISYHVFGLLIIICMKGALWGQKWQLL